MTTKKQPDSFDYLYDKFIKGDPEEERLFEEDYNRLNLALKLSLSRKEARLSRREVAEKAGTAIYMVRKLEEGDYNGPIPPEFDKIYNVIKNELGLLVN